MTGARARARARARPAWAGLIAVLLVVSALGASPVQPEVSEPRVPIAPADHDLLSDVIEQGGVTTAMQKPGIAPWVAYTASRLFDAIFDWLSPLGEYAGSVGSVFVWLARILVTIMLALLLWILVRYGIQRFHRPPESARPDVAALELEHRRRERDRDEWRRELEERLTTSDVRGALEATWWWLARSVLGEAVRSSWTSGELLSQAGRPALREPLRSLERFMYGGVRPSVDEVRALARRLEETLS